MAEKSSGGRTGAIILLAIIAIAIYYFLSKGDLRDPRPGELLLSGKVGRGPGGGCWILNAENGEMYNFIGDDLANAQKVGAKVKMLVRPEMDKVSPCNQGRVVTVLEFRVMEAPRYDRTP